MINNCNNCNNSNNSFNNSGSNNEVLFWSVYRNLYLKDQIFYHLLNDDIEFTNYKEYHFENRKRFKYIVSVGWMLENKQYELLKYKLQCNEVLDMGKIDIRFNRYGDTEFDKDQQREILKLLLRKDKRYYHQLCYDLYIQNAIYFGDEELFLMLLEGNDQYFTQIHLNSALSRPNATILKRVIKLFNGIDNNNLSLINKGSENSGVNKVKEFTIPKFKLEVPIGQLHRLILGSPELLNSWEFSKDARNLNHINPQFVDVVDKLLDLNYFTNNTFDSLVYKCIDKVDQILILFKVFYKFTLKINMPESIKESINQILNNECSCINNNDKEEKKKKELLKLLVQISKSKSLYSSYYSKYYQLVEFGSGDSSISEFYLKSNIIGIIERMDHLTQLGNKDQIIEFFELSLLNHIKYLKRKSYTLANKINQIIYNVMDTKESYEKIVQVIFSSGNKIGKQLYLQLEWSNYYKCIMDQNNGDVIVIKDKEIIDIISRFSLVALYSYFDNLLICYFNKINKSLIQFENKYLEDYSFLKIPLKRYDNKYENIKFGLVRWSQIKNNQFGEILNQLSLSDTVIGGEQFQSNQNNIKKLICYELKDKSGISKEGVLEFDFKPILLKYLIYQISESKSSLDCINCNSVLSIINNQPSPTIFKDILLHSLIDSILSFNYSQSRVILNLIDLDLNSKKFFQLLKGSNYSSYKKNKDLFKFIVFKERDVVSFIYNISPNNAVEYLKLWINVLSKLNLESKSTVQLCNTTINFIFKLLIKVSGITFYEIKSIRSLIQQEFKNKVELEHSEAHSFYYLVSKSNKLTKYIVSTILKISRETEKSEGWCSCCISKKNNLNVALILPILLDSKRYTIEFLESDFINNNPNGEALEIILDDLRITEKENLGSNFYQVYIYQYYLTINRIDLFFKHIQLKNELNYQLFMYLVPLFIKRLSTSSADINYIDKMIQQFSDLSNKYYSLNYQDIKKNLIKNLELLKREDLINIINNNFK